MQWKSLNLTITVSLGFRKNQASKVPEKGMWAIKSWKGHKAQRSPAFVKRSEDLRSKIFGFEHNGKRFINKLWEEKKIIEFPARGNQQMRRLANISSSL